MMKSNNSNYNDGEFQLEDEEVGENQIQSGHGKGKVVATKNRVKKNTTKSYFYIIMGICLVLCIVLWIAPGVYVMFNQGHSSNGNESNAVASRPRRMDASPLPTDPATTTSTVATMKQQPNNIYKSSPNDPIATSLRLIDDPTLIMKGYPAGEEGCNALTNDIYNASAILANRIILSNAQQVVGGGGGWGYYSSDSKGMVRSRSPSFSSSSSEMTMRITDTSYVSNNQEDDVDEADIMKSDGKHVFTAYGDMLVVWDVESGKEVSLTKLPKRQVLSWPNGGYCDHDRKARITGLLLDTTSKRLVVIASGYSHRYRYDYDGPKPVLGGKDDTRVFLYDVSSLPDDGSELTLLSTESMNGVYESARMVDGVAHVVRMSTIYHYEHISSRLSRHRVEYKSDNRGMYIAHAKSNAEQWLLRGFAKQLTEELRGGSGGGDCSAVTKLALYVSGDDLGDDFPPSVMSYGNIIQSYVQVSSFVIATPKNKEGSVALNPSFSSSIFPSKNLEIYSSKNVLVIAGRGYHYDRRRRAFSESTYFLSFRLQDNASSPSPAGLASAPGYLLNQFSMDEHEGYFRVATAEQAKWDCVRSRRNSPCSWKIVSESKNRLSVFKFPSTGGEMELVKVVDNLGVRDRETIKSVRFFDTKAFLVTFRTKDPLYSIDFSKPEEPTIAHELKNISGYSSYLHPVPNDKLLAIGKEANETTGEVSGFQITLFNISNLQDVQLLQRHTVKEKWASSSAESDHLAFRYLPKSQLLILPISIHYDYWRAKEEKIQPFDGFQVFSVTDDSIEPRFNISMATPSSMESGCWYGAYLPARSMVFEGNLTVAKGHVYTSYDLNTETLRWRHNLDSNLRGEQCSNYW